MDDNHLTPDDDNDDEFEDAYDTVVPRASSMDLHRALQEAKIAVNLFFNNQFQDAWDVLKPWVGTSMYHTVGNSVFHFLEAVLTFEPANIQKASDALKCSMNLCNYYRKKNTFSDSLGKMVKRINYDHYSTEEIHAELCYAESLLLKAMLTFIEDETLVSFIKAGLKIRSCFTSYKDCQTILNTKHWNNESHEVHFESGVRMGIGAFNLMISLLPSRVIKLLEFIGFSGSKELGMNELFKCYNLDEGLRHILSVLTLLTYNLIVVYVLSHCDGDLQLCDEILTKQLKIYPNGAWFLYFKGRLEFMRGNIVESGEWYIKSWKSQSVWPQFHHLCFWELMWTRAVVQDWDDACKYADMLLKESKWSRTIYSYQKATIMLMKKDNISEEQKKEINELMSNVPKYKQRIAGKSLPMEKFCIKKSERYFAQDKKLVLPALELVFVWNLFKVIGKKWDFCITVYKVIERTLRELDSVSAGGPYDADNRALVLLLKGACLHQMKKPLQAEEALESVLSLEKKIKDDNYLIPYALVELAMIHHEQGDMTRALQILEDAKKNYTGYSLESRLHFQIHSALLEFNNDKKRTVENGVKITKPSSSK
ncbi:tetratricopeptide repeat protein 39B-like [Lycorma delicatula]|uniref:tetratricopeptide repeat protein 39B-like n=1 Tax=Lycorma delicatula TaxID=130591 RepID=UPI003F50FD3E